MSSRLRVWGPAAAWAAVLFLLSAWPNPQAPSWFAVDDKVVHALLYGVMGVALAYGRVGAPAPPPHWTMILAGALYGGTDEWHQAFVRGRTPDWGDWRADLIGVVVGYTLVLVLVRWRVTSKSTDDGVDVAD